MPLTLPFSGIVHHLSGANSNAHTQTSQQYQQTGTWCSGITSASHAEPWAQIPVRPFPHELETKDPHQLIMVRFSHELETSALKLCCTVMYVSFSQSSRALSLYLSLSRSPSLSRKRGISFCSVRIGGANKQTEFLVSDYGIGCSTNWHQAAPKLRIGKMNLDNLAVRAFGEVPHKSGLGVLEETRRSGDELEVQKVENMICVCFLTFLVSK